jgi:uncharacterized protein involved in exopolysaccharide biosynthesis
MPEPFDVSEYAAYLKKRWKFWVVACGSAGCIALAVSLLLPRKYTATVSIVIQPASSRSGSVASPVYLESLKMYETFASSDVIFQQALERFHLRGPDSPSAETLKKKILEVVKLRDTRILQISATLPDPAQALGFAQYIAAETVRLNQGVTGAVNQDALSAAEKEAAAARDALDRAEAEWTKFPESGAVDALQEELSSLADLKARTQRELMDADVNVASLRASPEHGGGRLAAAEARSALLAHQAASTAQEFERRNAHLSSVLARRNVLQSRVDSSRKIYESAEMRLQELRGSSGLDVDRLKILDNGTLPTRPSFPKTVRNIEAAVLFALIASLIYLSISFTTMRRAPARYRLSA